MATALKKSSHVDLLIKPTRWWSQTLWDVIENGEMVTTFDISSTIFRQNVFQVGADCFELKRHGWFGGEQLLQNGNVVCTSKARLATRVCAVQMGDCELLLSPNRFPNTRYRLEMNGKECGWIRPIGVFSTRAAASLPSELPVGVRVFLLWLFLNGSLAYQTAG